MFNLKYILTLKIKKTLLSFALKFDESFQDLTEEKFWEVSDSDTVKNVAAQIAAQADKYRSGEWDEKQWHDFKTPLKKQLPVMTACGCSTNGRTRKEDMADSGLLLFDVDGMRADPREFFEQRVRPRIGELKILLAKVSISGCGIQLISLLPQDMDRQQATEWMAGELGVGAEDDPECPYGHYDTKVFDLSHKSFFVPSDHVLHLSNELFAEREVEISSTAQDSTAQDSTSQAADAQSAAYQTATATAPVCYTGTLPQRLDDVPADLKFDGIAYRDIISLYFQKMLGHEPVPGQRDSQLQKLITNLVTISDYDEALMLQLVPTYGLEDRVVREKIHRYCTVPEKDKPSGSSTILMDIVRELQQTSEMGDAFEQNALTSTMPPDIVRRLPKAMQITLSMAPQNASWPVMAGLLPMLGCLADQVQFRYCDQTMSHLGLFAFVVGGQASGKSIMKRVEQAWMHTIKEADKVSAAAKAQYKKDWKVWVAKAGKGSKQEPPQEPKCPIRYVQAKSSATDILQQLMTSEGHCLFMFTTEASEISNNAKAGVWAQKYDCFNKAYHREEYGQSYVSDQSVSGVEPVALNCSWTGTYAAFYKIFNLENVESGLSSRFIVAPMPDDRFSPMPRYTELTAKQQQIIDEAAQRLMNATGEVKVPRLTKAIDAWEEQKRQEAQKNGDDVMDEYRKRAGMTGMRAGVACYVMSGTKREPDVAIDYALYVAEQTLAGQLKYFGEMRRKQLEQPIVPVVSIR